MSTPILSPLEPEAPSPKRKIALENETAVLVLGIISLVICGAGFITSIISIVMGNQAIKAYKASPELYKESSYKNVKAGRTCGIVGLSLHLLVFLVYIGMFGAMFFFANETNSYVY